MLRGRCWWKSSFYWKKIGRTWTNFQYISKFSAMRTAGGRCVRKWRFSKEETAFAGSKLFSGAFILYSVRNEQLGAMRQKMAIFKERNSVCRVHIFLMIMMMMISCWCCDDDASLSSISFLKSLIAQQPFCKMILTKLFFFWDRRINVILFFFRATGWKRKSEKTKNVWPKNAQPKTLWVPACLNASQGPFVTGVPLKFRHHWIKIVSKKWKRKILRTC